MAKSVEIKVHDFDYRLYQTLNLIKRDFSKANARIIKKYDIEMINQTLAKATRWKHLQTLVNLTKMIKKDWEEVTKEDIDELVSEIMERFGSSNGQESNYSYLFVGKIKRFNNHFLDFFKKKRIWCQTLENFMISGWLLLETLSAYGLQ